MGRRTKRLLILSESQRRVPTQKAVPAFELYSGVYFRVFKKYLREGHLRNVDLLILTKEKGLIHSDALLEYQEPSPGPAVGRLSIKRSEIERFRVRNVRFVKNLLKTGSYVEIYVNVGRELWELLKGIETLGTRTTMAKGGGLGPKAKDMKEWILNLPK